MKKPVDKLSIHDFYEYPVWTWAEEDDETIVIPWVKQDPFEDHDAFFVLAIFTLSDGTQVNGIVGVRVIDLSVFLVSIVNEEGELKDVSLNITLTQMMDQEIIAKHLNKQLEEIFPLQYSANDALPVTIEGIIN